MSVKDTVRRQYIRLVDQAAHQAVQIKTPSEGWISLVRKALCMSGAQLARRAGVTRSAVYQAERNEREGAVTIKQMDKMARAMNCRFVYAIVPESRIEEVMQQQALYKARTVVGKANAHMALESQALSEDQIEQEIKRMAEDLVRDRPSDFWEER